MTRTRILKVRFDLSNADDALTYARLKDSSRRACRLSMAWQAQYLLKRMLGVRMFESLELTGLTVVHFPAQVKTYQDIKKRALKSAMTKAMKGR